MSKHVTYDTPACRAARQLCIERHGKCRGCPHAVPSLGNTCEIRKMAEVIAVIGKPKEPWPTIEPDRPTRPARKYADQICRECGGTIAGIRWRRLLCDPCIAAKAAKPRQPRPRVTKMNPDRVRAALDLLAQGQQRKAVAEIFGISIKTLDKIIAGIIWRDVHEAWHQDRRKQAG